MKELYFILFNKSLTKVFMVNGNLPLYKEKVSSMVSFDDTSKYNKWFKNEYNIDVFRRYVIENDDLESTYFLLDTEDLIDDNKLFIDITNINNRIRNMLELIVKDYNNSGNVPWMTNDGFNPFINWGIKTLSVNGINNINNIVQIKNAYVSTVFRYETDKGDYYLKIPSSSFVKEVEILDSLLSRKYIPSVDVIDINKDRTAYLMRDMGGSNLEDDFKLTYIYDTVTLIARLQKEVIKNFDEKDFKKFYDQSLPAMLIMLDEIEQDSKVLLLGSKYSLTIEEYNELNSSLNRYKELLININDIIPYSIDHGDLRSGNIRVNTEKGQIIYDYAWSTYTHPFFSVINLIYTTRRNHIVKNNKDKIIRHYLEQWLNYADIETLTRIYIQLEKLIRVSQLISDTYWLKEINISNVNPYSIDYWLLDRRQYYYSYVLRKLIINK